MTTQINKSVNQTILAYGAKNGAGCWGKSDNLPNAIANCKSAGSLKRGDKVHVTLYAAPQDKINVTSFGNVEYPEDTARFDLGIIKI